MNDELKISNIGSVRNVISQVLMNGIKDVVLSPGSRNAPFILSFTALKQFDCQSVLDERSAGFVALGIAQQTQRPVILSCTSGSAVLNYMPAIAEAYYQRIPLIAITADRPAARIDQGEGQSLRQLGIMDNIVAKACNLVEEHTAEDQWYNRRMIAETISTAVIEQRPVQINVPLHEPLYNIEAFGIPTQNPLQVVRANHAYSDGALTDFKKTWQKSERILVLLTQGNAGQRCFEALKKMSEDPRVAIVTESTANLYHLGFVACVDRTIEGFLNTDQESDFIPDLLVSVGDNVISKKLKALFRKHKQSIDQHWHFGSEMLDTFESLTHLIDGPAHALFDILADMEVRSESNFGSQWKTQYFKTEEGHNQFVPSCRWSDLKAFHNIMDFIPDQSVLQMGNSSVVRYIQLFNPIRNIKYFGNRGVSGIEGCTSTAIGAAQRSNTPVVLISGDQAFRYDSNALALASTAPRLRIIVINNGGGNIFRIIDGPQNHEVSEAFIEKKDEGSIQKLVEYYDVAYLKATDEKELESALMKLFSAESDGCMVLEVFTPRHESPDELKAYFKFLKEL